MDFRDLGSYEYELPPELIRKKGVEPRDSSRLFVYDTKTDAITHDFFHNLANHLPERSLMALNETRVVPSRLWLRKETGGKIEAFILANEWDGGGEIPLLVDRKCVPGMRLLFPNGDRLEIVRQEEGKFFALLESDKSLETLLDTYGETPIPHYLEDEKGDNGERELGLRKRYQTVFAKTGASVAAPTASLHFTDGVFASLDAKGIGAVKVTLDVGQGTFAPLREEHFRTGKLHRERIEVSAEAAERLGAARTAGRPIIAVGTTALRTLESVVIPSETRNPGILHSVQNDEVSGCIFAPCSGPTDIFIYPPHTFRSADILITNFHLPKTSLMLLVDAFLEWKGAPRRIMPLYAEAIRERYAFYSFGDSMLIL